MLERNMAAFSLESNIAVPFLNNLHSSYQTVGALLICGGKTLYIAGGFPWRIQMSSPEGHFSQQVGLESSFTSQFTKKPSTKKYKSSDHLQSKAEGDT